MSRAFFHVYKKNIYIFKAVHQILVDFTYILESVDSTTKLFEGTHLGDMLSFGTFEKINYVHGASVLMINK